MALTVKIRADASQFKKTIAGVEVQASGLTGVIGKLGGAIGTGGFAAALTAAAAAAAALGAGIAFLKSSSQAAMSIESLSAQIEVLTGSSATAAELIKKFREEAIKSPLSVKDYADASKLLMGYGVAAKDTIPSLKMLGDISMGNAERFGRLALVFGQITTKGRLLAQENNQLAESGFAPLQIIAKKTGETMAQLYKRMETTGISANEVTDAMKSATSKGGLFFGALDRGAATTEGKLAKLGDAVMGLKVSFGTGFNEGLKSALDATNEFLPKLESKFATAGEMLGFAIKESIAGNHEMLAAIGAIIGETIMAGIRATIKIGFSSLVREGIGGYVGLGGHLTGNPETKVAGHAINAGIAGMLGSGTSMADTIKSESGGIERAIAAMEKLVESKSENLPRGFVNKYDNMEKLQTEYLRKISEQSGYQLMFSR